MNSKRTLTKKITCTVGAIASAIVLATSLPSYAQTKGGHDCEGPHHFHKGMGDRGAMMQKRMDKLKADLKIQPNQEGAWQAYTAKLKEQGEKMKAHHQQAHSDTNLTLPERLDQRINAMKQHQANMEEMAGATKTFYASLTPEQQLVMDKHFSHHDKQRRG